MNWDWKKDTCNSREKTKYCCTHTCPNNFQNGVIF